MSKRNNNGANENVETETSGTQVPNTGSKTHSPAVEAAARLSAAFPLGAQRLDSKVVTFNGLSNGMGDTTAVPGVAVIDYIPTYGLASDAMAAVNRALMTQFNDIRSQISGNRPYEPVDHMIYRFCVESLRALYASIVRIYGMLRTYRALNLYSPRDIFKAMNLDYDAWSRDAANVYQWLINNSTALLPFPTIPVGNISERQEAFNTYLFKDGDAETAQTYIFNQIAYYSYEGVDEVKGIKLRYRGSTPADFFDLWDDMYKALQNSSDVYIIAADIRRAFADKVVTDLSVPGENYEPGWAKLDPVLTSIMNTNTLLAGRWDGNTITYPARDSVLNDFKIRDAGDGTLRMSANSTQMVMVDKANDSGVVVFGPGVTSHCNFVESNPDTTAILNATRFRYGGEVAARADVSVLDPQQVDFTFTSKIDSIGTEVVTAVRYVIRTENSDFSTIVPGATVMFNCVTHDPYFSKEYLMIQALNVIDNFDWAVPMCIANVDITGNPIVQYSGMHEDIQNYVPVRNTNIKQIHDAVLLEEFGVQ